MPSLRNPSTRNALMQRLNNLTSTAKPEWGKLDAPRMVCHLGAALAMALGEIPTQSVHQKAFQHFPLKHLFLYLVPMPKGGPTAPELLATPPGDFEADRQRTVDWMARLAATPRALGPEHPFFGVLTNEEWNVLQWRHIDHHLRQFGL